MVFLSHPGFKVHSGKSVSPFSLGCGIWGDIFLLTVSCGFQNSCHRHVVFSQAEKTEYGFLSIPAVSVGMLSAVTTNPDPTEADWGPGAS